MKRILVTIITAGILLATTHSSYATWSLGTEGFASYLINSSASRYFKNPAWGGSLYVFYAPEIFWEFIGFGLRESYTRLNAKSGSGAADSHSWDTLLGGRLAFLDEPFEDWAVDLKLELGGSYFVPGASTGKSSLHFTYAIGSNLRYYIFEEGSLGLLLRWHQVFGSYTLATNTRMSELNTLELGLLFEFSL